MFGRHRLRIRDFEGLPGRPSERRDDAHPLPRRRKRLVTLEIVANKEEDGRVRQRRRPEERIAIAPAEDIEVEQLTIDLSPDHTRIQPVIGRGAP